MKRHIQAGKKFAYFESIFLDRYDTVYTAYSRHSPNIYEGVFLRS